MANAVAALYTSLTLESSQFIANAKRTATATEQMSNNISKSLTVAKSAVQGFIAVAGVGLVTNTIKNALNYAAAIDETSQQLGIAAKKYQELKFAASQSGVAQSELETGIARLTRNIGTGSKAFDQLGISIRDSNGNSRSTGDVFNDIADKLGKVEDPAKRAAYEVALFGKSGQKLDPLLSGGTTALNAMADEAERLGLVLSDEQINKADAAADAFARVKVQLSANISGAVADNATAILSLANAFGSLIKASADGLSALRTFYQDGNIRSGDFANKLPWTSDSVKKRNNDYKANVQIERFGSLLPWANGSFKPKAAPMSGGGLDDPAAKIDKIAKAATAAKKPVKDFADALYALEGSTIAGQGGVSSIFATDDQIYSDTVSKLTTLGDMTSLIQPVDLIDNEQLARVTKFGESLSSNLGTALVYGQNLGDALVNSLKAAAAEAIASGLFKILTGGGSGGGVVGSIVGAIGKAFGGGFAKGGVPPAGKISIVGENGPEWMVGNGSSRIIPMGAGGGAGGGGMVVNVDARGSNDPAAVRAQVMMGIAQAAPALLAAARGETIAKLRRPQLAGGRG